MTPFALTSIQISQVVVSPVGTSYAHERSPPEANVKLEVDP